MMFFSFRFLMMGTFVFCTVNAVAQTYGISSDRAVIHHVGPLTNSVLAASNLEALDAADLYLKSVNTRGGVNGRKVVLMRHDDNQDPKKTAEIAKRLIDERSGLGFMMPRTSPSTEALMPMAQEANLLLLGPQVGPSTVTAPMRRNVFAVRAEYSAEVARAIELQHIIGRRKFAFLVANDSFGNDVLKQLDKPMGRFNLKPVGIERIDNRNPDMTQAVANFAKLQPDVVIAVCAPKCSADFIKGYAATGGFTQLIALSNAGNSGFIKELGDRKSGVIVMQVMPSPTSGKTAVATAYREAATAAKQPLSYQGLQGFITAKLLVEGLRRAGKNPTPTSLVNALEGLGEHDLGGFIVKYGPKERMGSKFVEETMINKDGRFIQ
jgi:branched-chain amino acid transport system substrate-binding protein